MPKKIQTAQPKITAQLVERNVQFDLTPHKSPLDQI